MIRFTEEEMDRIRAKQADFPETLHRLKAGVQEILDQPPLVPQTGIANWKLYYYCPDCSVRLLFDRSQPERHVCPHCGRVLQGEPYDSAWWGIVNSENAQACEKLGLLWQLERDRKYADRALDIMTAYASVYESYAVHGDIPYNGPGKANAQTLDEGIFLRQMASAFDMLSDAMTGEQAAAIRDHMLLPGAEFLIPRRKNQMHNHEVAIDAAIAVIGILFGKNTYADFAVNQKYGLRYQLEHGMQPNGMWFEGSFGYHFYALENFLAFEKFALHTPYSMIHHPNYQKMLGLLADYLEPGDRMPMLNDTNFGHMGAAGRLYEFAWREIGGEKILYVLNGLTRETGRDNAEALLYGADALPESGYVPEKTHIEPGNGCSILHGPDGRYLLVKHDRYGGEHDHYDRLDLDYLAYGRRISPDLGTTGYGAPMHYDYYKNTATHNTINIGGKNQSPVNARLTDFRVDPAARTVWLDTLADWTEPFAMPDTFTIRQWDEKAYTGVRMRRQILWAERYFIEVTSVQRGLAAPDSEKDGCDTAADKSVNWVMHFSGRPESVLLPAGAEPLDAKEREKRFPEGRLSLQKPWKHVKVKDAWRLPAPEDKIPVPAGNPAGQKGAASVRDDSGREACAGTAQSGEDAPVWQISFRDGDVCTDVFGCGAGQELISGTGPDNPSVSDINYLVEQVRGNGAEAVDFCGGEPEPKNGSPRENSTIAVFAHVFASRRSTEAPVHVHFRSTAGRLRVTVDLPVDTPESSAEGSAGVRPGAQEKAGERCVSEFDTGVE